MKIIGLYLYRFFLTTSLFVVIPWVIVSRVWNEIKDIPFYVKNDIAGEIDSFKQYWKDYDPLA